MMTSLLARPCAPEESKTWMEFLDRSFGYQAPQSYGVDFAPLFARTALPRSRLVWEGGKILSSATFYPVRAIMPGSELKLAIVGAVATDEKYRGRGFSSFVLADLEKAARAEGCDGLILWSDQAPFYDKLGFKPVGRQQILPLDTLARPERIVPGTPVYGWDWDQVRSLYEKHVMHIRRDDEYWKSLEEISSCTRVQWMNADGRVTAYIGFDRGKDLQGVIHEWGGERDALHCLVWTVLQSRPHLFWLTQPRLLDPIRERLAPEATPIVDSSLALFKSLSAEHTAGDLENVWFWGLDSL